MRLTGWMTLCFALLTHVAAHAELLSAEVVIIANANDPASMRVADHYVQARHIPAGHRLNLDLPSDTDISRADYQRLVLEPVRRTLQHRGLADQVRCIVLSYNLPLRVAAAPGSWDDRYETQQLQSDTQRTLADLRQTIAALNALAGGTAHTVVGNDLPGVMRAISQSLTAAAKHIKATTDPAARATATRRLLQYRLKLFGPAGIIEHLSSATAAAPQQQTKLQAIRSSIQSAELAIMLLNNRDELPARRERRRLQSKYFGLLGTYRNQLADLIHTRRTSAASLDSELSLLWWRDYPLNDRLPNVAGYNFERIRDQLGQPPVLITGRLQARSEATAIRMIDDAVAVDSSGGGLRGKAYIDARSITKPGYDVYDQSLLDLAAILRGSMRVTLDTQPAVMPSHSGDDAAIYCGWYALRHYNAPVKFVRGAVAIHIASYEATDFSPSSTEWAAGLLDDGAAVTVGAVAEPYLDAFPLPSDFYQLLLTGKYSVGEVYLLTSRWTSWQMTLLGDPIYNPYRRSPVLTMKQVKLALPVFDQVSDAVAAGAQRIVENAVGETATAEAPARQP